MVQRGAGSPFQAKSVPLDLRDENLRRLLVNSVYWGFGMDVPAKADVQLVGDFQPSAYSFNGFRKGVKPDDLALPEAAK